MFKKWIIVSKQLYFIYSTEQYFSIVNLYTVQRTRQIGSTILMKESHSNRSIQHLSAHVSQTGSFPFGTILLKRRGQEEVGRGGGITPTSPLSKPGENGDINLLKSFSWPLPIRVLSREAHPSSPPPPPTPPIPPTPLSYPQAGN